MQKSFLFALLIMISSALVPLTVTTAKCGTPELLFEAGSKAYLEGDWEKAAESWMQIVHSGYSSGELFYNLGNVYYKLGNMGLSVLYWEKAAGQLGDENDIQANLALVRTQLKDKIDESAQLPFWTLLNKFRTHFPPQAVAVMSIILCSVFFILAGYRRWFAKKSKHRMHIKTSLWIFAVLTIFHLSLLILDAYEKRISQKGVIIVNESTILSAPAESTGKMLFNLHSGTKVEIVRELEDWYEISTGKDKAGWIPKRDLGVI